MNPFRYIAWLFFSPTPPKRLSAGSEKEEIKNVAANLVRRARRGDQNAMAQIGMVGKNAAKGNKRAQYTAKQLEEYINANPPEEKPNRFGVDKTPVFRSLKNGVRGKQYCTAVVSLVPKAGKENVDVCCVILANGPKLDNHRIKALGAAYGEDSELFYHGVKNHSDEEEISTFAADISSDARKTLHTGICVGKARSLQIVRLEGTPITPYSAEAGWELGE